MNLSTLGEFGLIARLHEKLAQRGGVQLGIGDDAAVLAPLTSPVVTCDALIEGVHFRLDWTKAHSLGWKAMAVNVSDIAAMGGLPVAAFVSLGLPPDCSVEWVEELYRGMELAAATYNFTIAGGDTVKSAELILNVALIGNATQPVLRSGAAPGDLLFVTGSLGDSAAGLEIMLNEHATSRDALDIGSNRYLLLARHHEPTPRLYEMQAALQVEGAVRAALDLSDGLAGDAAHIARRSNVTLEIDTALLPISDECRALATAAKRDVLEYALAGGEDYELLLCIAPDKVDEVMAALQSTRIPLTHIGRCIERENAPVVLLKNGEREAAPIAFTHF